MTYTRTTADEWHVEVNYGAGWEHETTEGTRADAVAQVKCYRANTNYPVRWRKRRVKLETATTTAS